MAANESFESEDLETNRENTDDLLAVQLAQTPENDDNFRPLLADAQKIGFFSLDRTTQTNTTEIVDIKELTSTIEQLLEDSANMRRDINFARSVMQAEFDAKLQSKALELYHRVNDKIADIERMHDDRVATVRRAFRQQLSDSLVRVQSLYTQNMDQKMKKERKKKDSEAGKWESKFKEMQATIQRNESIIQVLKMQLSQYQEKEEELMSFRSKSTKTPSINPAELELEDLKADVEKYEKQISRLQEALDIKEKDCDDLNKELQDMTDQLEKERILVEQIKLEQRRLRVENFKLVQAEKLLTMKSKQQIYNVTLKLTLENQERLSHEKDEMSTSAEADAGAIRRKMEEQRLELEEEMNTKIQQIREEALAEAKREAENAGSIDRETIQRLNDEKRMLEQLVAKERARANEKSKEQLDLEKAKRNEATMLSQISRLKKEIDRVHKTWEKKFAILQQSLHALKDESYLRQTMQKQAAQLHQASISYAMDTPQGIMAKPQGAPPMSPKKPLPNIHNKQSKRANTPPDYISYTVSAPSGRATTLFSADGHVYTQLPPGEVFPSSLPSDSAFHSSTSFDKSTCKTSDQLYSYHVSPTPHPNTPSLLHLESISNCNNSARQPSNISSCEKLHPSKQSADRPVYLYDNTVYLEEENQIMSDDEQDLPDDIVPLPPPPDRNMSYAGDDSRPSTRSQVVVLPKA